MNNEQVLYAIEVATYWHGEQTDKAGKLYLFHPLYVMLQMDTNEERALAILHDCIEDTYLTIQTLRDAEVFSEDFLASLNAISKHKGENNIDYWTRVKANPLALKVKLADIGHNSSEDRLKDLPKEEADYLRNKYTNARDFFAHNNGLASVVVGMHFGRAHEFLKMAGYEDNAWRHIMGLPDLEVGFDNIIRLR